MQEDGTRGKIWNAERKVDAMVHTRMSKDAVSRIPLYERTGEEEYNKDANPQNATRPEHW